MGKTNPTYRGWYEQFRSNDLEQFRRALRKPEQDRLATLLDDAEYYSIAACAWNAKNPRWPAVFSCLLAQQKRIDELENMITEVTDGGETG